MLDENSMVVTHSLNISLVSDSTSNTHSTQYAISAIYIYLYIQFILHLGYFYYTANMFTSISVVCVCVSQIWLVLFLHRCNIFLLLYFQHYC